jgi:hypothetical protein
MKSNREKKSRCFVCNQETQCYTLSRIWAWRRNNDGSAMMVKVHPQCAEKNYIAKYGWDYVVLTKRTR